MKYSKLQDRLYRSLGTAARHTGRWGDAFRPRSPHSPLAPESRFLKLPVTLDPLMGSGGGDAFEHIFWRGTFDGCYTKPGDYIVLNGQIYFIASQEPLQPIICIRTNRIVSIARSTQVPVNAAGAYGGFSPANASAYLSEYPASVLIESKMSAASADLPTDQAIPYWTVYLPSHPDITIMSGDFISDDMGRSALVSYADQSIMGWRLIAKMAST